VKTNTEAALNAPKSSDITVKPVGLQGGGEARAQLSSDTRDRQTRARKTIRDEKA
jgi:hypothetical protein